MTANLLGLQPTVRIERTDLTILGLPIKVWDFGGQEQYRQEHLLRQQYFDRTNLLFYIVDIQDPERFQESFGYFLNILEIIVELDLEPYILVFFHKSDPEFKDSPELLKFCRDLEGLFNKLPQPFKITFHQTSIFDYEPLTRIIVQAILKVLPKGAVIQDILNNFMNKSESSAIMLLDENVLPIAEAYSTEKARDICRICGPHFATMVERLEKYQIDSPNVVEVEMKGWLFFKKIIYENTKFYLIFFTHAEKNFLKINSILPIFTKDLFNVIRFVWD
ncbi:MAG: hypothetical protein EU536_02780 [Promethearchaeota archaeon]|nr:MAG: hypothetical protein EU536_02780 [Candidatus Lokiarchaeota archaeon]